MGKSWTLRALALGNANAKCKGYLALQAPKYIASGNAIAKYCKFFCNSVSTILKKQKNKYFIVMVIGKKKE